MATFLTITSFLAGMYIYHLSRKIYYWLKPNKDAPDYVLEMLMRQYVKLEYGNIADSQFDEIIRAIAKHYHLDENDLYNAVIEERDNMRLKAGDKLFKYE